MLTSCLKSLREEREEGFTLIELLVVILIIGILAAIAIPVFMNQRKVSVDATVESDVRNTASAIEDWAVSHPNEVIKDQVLTQTANAAGVPSNQIAIAGLSALVAAVGAADDAKVSNGNTVFIKGSTVPGEFCVYGVNPNGKTSATDAGIFYDSGAGGLNKMGAACKATDGKIDVPSDVAAVINGKTSGSTGGANGGNNGAGETTNPVDTSQNMISDGYKGTVSATNASGETVNLDWTASVGGPSYKLAFTSTDTSINGDVTIAYTKDDGSPATMTTPIASGSGKSEWVVPKDFTIPTLTFKDTVAASAPIYTGPVETAFGSYESFVSGTSVKVHSINKGPTLTYWVSEAECLDGTKAIYPYDAGRGVILWDGEDEYTRIVTTCGATLKAYKISPLPSSSSDPTIDKAYTIGVRQP